MSKTDKWEALSMRDRALLIREAIRNGITDIGSIRATWEHRFDGNSDQPTEDPGIWNIKGWFSENESIEEKPTTEGYVDLNEIKRRQAWAESRFKDNAVSRAGATGRFQVMPNVQADYIKAGGRDGNLKDPKYNEEVRDWQMEQLAKRPWVNKEGSTDSVKVGKQLAAYNYGPTNVVNALNKAKAAGIDIYNSFDWVDEEYLPKETVDYVNWVLRNKPTGVHRNDPVYNLNKHKYSGSEHVIRDALDLYNPWSAESMVAKASSPLVEDGVIDLDTAKKAVIGNDEEAREQMAKAHRNAAIASGAAAAGTVLATGAFTPAITHALQVLGNPALAKTTAGALTAAGLSATGTVAGISDLYDTTKRWTNGEFDWTDIPRTALNVAGIVPMMNTVVSGIKNLKLPTRAAKLPPKASDPTPAIKHTSPTTSDDIAFDIQDYIDNRLQAGEVGIATHLQNKLNRGMITELPKGTARETAEAFYDTQWYKDLYASKIRENWNGLYQGMPVDEAVVQAGVNKDIQKLIGNADKYSAYQIQGDIIPGRPTIQGFSNAKAKTIAMKNNVDVPDIQRFGDPTLHSTRWHEVMHASTDAGNPMSEPLIVTLQRQKFHMNVNNNASAELKKYLGDSEEQRIRLLRLKAAKDFNPATSQMTEEEFVDHIIGIIAQHPHVLQNTDPNIRQLFRYFDRDELVKGLKHVLTVGTPVGVGAAISSQDDTESSHKFSGEDDTSSEKGASAWSKLANAILEGGRMVRDARIGAVGAEQIRQLYNEGNTEEAKQRANEYLKANLLGIGTAVAAAPLLKTAAVKATAGIPLLTESVPATYKVARVGTSLLGSLIAGEATDKASLKMTGKTVGENIYGAVRPALPDKWKENPFLDELVGPIAADMFNPGYGVGARVVPSLGRMTIKAGGAAMQQVQNAGKRTAEVIVRAGDAATDPKKLLKQLLNKNAISYILNPKAGELAYQLPIKYSGRSASPVMAPAAPGDIVDIFFDKSKTLKIPMKTGTTTEIPVTRVANTDPRLPEGARRWLQAHGKKEASLITLGDLGEEVYSPFDRSSTLSALRKAEEGVPTYMGAASSGIPSRSGELLIDPGGYNRIIIRQGDDAVIHNFDIWKFTSPEYVAKYIGKGKQPKIPAPGSASSRSKTFFKEIKERLKRNLQGLGLWFIDKQGTPIVTMWDSNFPKTSLPQFSADPATPPEASEILTKYLKEIK